MRWIGHKNCVRCFSWKPKCRRPGKRLGFILVRCYNDSGTKPMSVVRFSYDSEKLPKADTCEHHNDVSSTLKSQKMRFTTERLLASEEHFTFTSQLRHRNAGIAGRLIIIGMPRRRAVANWEIFNYIYINSEKVMCNSIVFRTLLCPMGFIKFCCDRKAQMDEIVVLGWTSTMTYYMTGEGQL